MSEQSITEEILQALARFFNQKIRFAQTIVGWPDFGEKLKYPCLSLLIKGSPVFQPYQSFELRRVREGELSVDSLYVVGDYDFRIQADAWIKTKSHRDDVYEQMFQAIHSQGEDVSSSLVLELPNYFGERATFYFDGYEFPDMAETSVTGEWRVIVKLRASCQAIVRRNKEPLITTSEAVIEISENEFSSTPTNNLNSEP